MDRRSCLALVGTVASAGVIGCLSDDGESTPAGTASGPRSDTATATGTPPTETATVPDVETPAPGECEAVAPPRPSTGDGLPDPRAYPEKPAAIEKSSAKTFVEEYEAAYRYNRRLADLAADGECLKYLDASVTESAVAAVENGFSGEVTTRASYTGAPCPGSTGTDTPTPLPHADLAHESAEYYLTDRFLFRNGTVVECWD
ncbi:hypothetical protein [Halosimplex amylolyticum]|uniref:hypothetical protein n=1 Tax=Halosimplex amylolyticum TaxID=3396616 RepID=UPI003F55F14E